MSKPKLTVTYDVCHHAAQMLERTEAVQKHLRNINRKLRRILCDIGEKGGQPEADAINILWPEMGVQFDALADEAEGLQEAYEDESIGNVEW